MKLYLPTHFPITEGKLTELFASSLNKKLDIKRVGLDGLSTEGRRPHPSQPQPQKNAPQA